MINIMPKDTATPYKPLVVALTYDGIAMFELSIAVEIFGLPRPEVGENWYRFATASLDPSPLRTTAGIQLITDGGLERFEEAHTIIIPSWRGPDRKVPEPLVEAIKAAHARGTRIASICGGAYVLAAAGLLEGRKATTHWRYIDEFRCDHPELNLLPNGDLGGQCGGHRYVSASGAAGFWGRNRQ
jgi:AraC family transcriptional regulator, transcriptional activator FtrA